MSEQRNSFPSGNPPDEMNARLAARLRASAALFAYPETPDLAAGERMRVESELAPAARERLRVEGELAPAARERLRVEGEPARPRSRRVAFALALLAIVLSAAFLASPARARVLEWIRIGAVRIFFPEPSHAPLPSTPTQDGAPSPQPSATYLQSVLDIGGETSLAGAQQQVGFPIRLPADSGQPDRVYLQEYDHPAVILVWLEDDRPGQVRMSLTQARSDTFIFQKYARRSVEETHVNGRPAVWVEGEYPLVTGSGEMTMTRLVTQGHTLIWTEGDLTFRLETDEDLDSAIRVAESLD